MHTSTGTTRRPTLPRSTASTGSISSDRSCGRTSLTGCRCSSTRPGPPASATSPISAPTAPTRRRPRQPCAASSLTWSAAGRQPRHLAAGVCAIGSHTLRTRGSAWGEPSGRSRLRAALNRRSGRSHSGRVPTLRDSGWSQSSRDIRPILYCMGSSGQVSVGHTELATMDVLEEGQIDPASTIMPDTCPGRRSGRSSRKPQCCGGRCVRPPVRHQSGSGAEQDKPCPAPTTPQVVTGTRAPRLPAVMRWRKGRLGRGLRRRARGSLLRADWVPVAEHQGRRILYATGTGG